MENLPTSFNANAPQPLKYLDPNSKERYFFHTFEPKDMEKKMMIVLTRTSDMKSSLILLDMNFEMSMENVAFLNELKNKCEKLLQEIKLESWRK